MAQCKIMRRITTHSYYGLELEAGIKNDPVDKECGIPTFGSDFESQNVCRQCNEGWNSEDNYILNTESNWILINDSLEEISKRTPPTRTDLTKRINEARRKFVAREHFKFDKKDGKQRF